MTKLEAIKHLEQAMQHNPEFRKKFQDYIELIVLEESGGLRLKEATRVILAKNIAKSIVNGFRGEWWSFALGEP